MDTDKEFNELAKITPEAMERTIAIINIVISSYFKLNMKINLFRRYTPGVHARWRGQCLAMYDTACLEGIPKVISRASQVVLMPSNMQLHDLATNSSSFGQSTSTPLLFFSRHHLHLATY